MPPFARRLLRELAVWLGLVVVFAALYLAGLGRFVSVLVAAAFGVGGLVFVLLLSAGAVHRSMRKDLARGRARGALWKARYLRLFTVAIRQRPFVVGLAFAQASALVDLGRWDDACALVAPYEGKSDDVRALYLALLAGLHERAKRFDDALRLAEEVVRLRPSAPDGWVDLARCRVLRFHDAAGARDALEKLGALVVPANTQVFAYWVTSMIALEEGRFAEARRDLDAALAGTVRFPLGYGFADVLHAHHAWALAGLGDHDGARRELAAARPHLEAARATTILADVDAALARLRAG